MNIHDHCDIFYILLALAISYARILHNLKLNIHCSEALLWVTGNRLTVLAFKQIFWCEVKVIVNLFVHLCLEHIFFLALDQSGQYFTHIVFLSIHCFWKKVKAVDHNRSLYDSCLDTFSPFGPFWIILSTQSAIW